MRGMKTILVPVDLSTASSRVCRTACDLARLIGGRVVLLHVAPPPSALWDNYYTFDAGQVAEAIAAAERSVTQGLQALARRFAARCPIRIARADGTPARGILAQAVATKAAYIVMGSHGHGAMFDLIVGSTTHGVLRTAPCPVMIVPADPR